MRRRPALNAINGRPSGSLEGRNERNTTSTEFEEFAAELAHAYAATE